MPCYCVALGCKNRSNREKDKKYFRVPKEVSHKGKIVQDFTRRRRIKWLANLSPLTKGAESKHARVCSDHFVKGCPSDLYSDDHEDWAPTLKLGHNKVKPKSKDAKEREDRALDREIKRQRQEGADALMAFYNKVIILDREPEQTAEHVDSPLSHKGTQANIEATEAGCQTDLTGDDIKAMDEGLQRINGELYELRAKTLDTGLNLDSLGHNEDKTKFYTGLPNFLVLMQLFKSCEPHIYSNSLTVLDKFQQFLLVLIRLRLNLPLQDLAYRFKISLPTVSRIWHKWIDVLYQRTKFLIKWPDRDILHDTMPMVFRQNFGTRVAVILDCFEVFIERPSNLLARAQTWSSYKHHNTVKFLIGISPQGLVTFISAAWGGRASDKVMTEESGILKNLLPGDLVLADRGFDISDSVGLYSASLQIPAFTKGKTQLSATEVEVTRKIANVRIHVERKYQILQSKAMPIEHMAVKPGETLALIDKIGAICCALTNLSESIVPTE